MVNNQDDLSELKKIVSSFTQVHDGYTMMGTDFCEYLIKATGGCPISNKAGEVQCPSYMKCLVKNISRASEEMADIIEVLPFISDSDKDLRSKAYKMLITTAKPELMASRLLVYKIFIDAERKIKTLTTPN